ncbi:hypothetical protein [Cyanobium sp. Morenito 9A2]|uniref:hypothetical protein n=1 Tax=Cyanobium sp. Morenito 9A2 TaxID=2823718 RepID=UPI0020CBE57A|nr:hypothetical protein [Cyanobium sp. Morenito 9A2]MCP9850527.1 hypothetical protein [Cyanobium sp. Morenito 9A2]
MALYLQVLRKALLHQVQQACFHLATQVHPERYGQLSATERAELHRRLERLVMRCGSLLTIEQLCGLGHQLEKEQRQQQLEQRQSILAALHSAEEAATDELPEGSVQLGLDVPLSAELFSEGLAGLVGFGIRIPAGPSDDGKACGNGFAAAETRGSRAPGPSDDLPEDGVSGNDKLETGIDSGELNDAEPEGSDLEQDDLDQVGDQDQALDSIESLASDSSTGFWMAGEIEDRSDGTRGDGERHGTGPSSQLRLMQSLFSLAAETMGRQPPPEQEAPQAPDAAAPAEPPSHRASPAAAPMADAPLLPSNPIELLDWWQALDWALQRRLRNLSHALNVDLLRLRLTRSLMPVNLLEAVLQGQIDPLNAPANVLRLQLPFASAAGGLQLESLGLLLRCGDLEDALPPLRTCRKRLEHQRLELRKMAQHHRHWQRRLHTLEAEQQWLQDQRQVNPPPS